MACFLTRRGRLTRETSTRDSITRAKKKHSSKEGPDGPLWSLWPVLNSHKLRVISGFIQWVSNFRTVNIMGERVCRHCPIPGCHSKFLVRLANHLTRVHELSELERKYWLPFAKLQNTNVVRVYDKEGEPNFFL